MSFSVGQTVVHPFHGPVTVRDITTRSVRGRVTEYLELATSRVPSPAAPSFRPLTISVPVDATGEVGLRPVMSPDDVQVLLTVLAGPALPKEKSWSRRVKDYQLRLVSGNPIERAVVVREILRANRRNPVAFEERDMLRRALDDLSSELALALSTSVDDARDLIERTTDRAGGRADSGSPTGGHA